jgi:hypothetical protein
MIFDSGLNGWVGAACEVHPTKTGDIDAALSRHEELSRAVLIIMQGIKSQC